LEYWDEDSLQDIGNGLGEFIKIAEETKLKQYTSYARICVYMHLSKALSDVVSIYHDDFEWVQAIYYEHVPFCYRKFHALGHLFRDCPSNLKSLTSSTLDKPDWNGFTKVTNHKKNHKKPSSNPKKPVTNASMPSTSNSFETLNQLELNNSKNPDHSK